MNPWPAAAIAELTRLHAQVPEISFLEISKRLQAQGYDVTRNGCIGKARRLGLPPRDPVIVQEKNTARLREAQLARKQRQGPTMTIIAKAPDLQPTPPVYTEPRGLLLIELEFGECKWPLNDGNPFRFCACSVHPGRPYCADHTSKAYHPVRQR